MTVQDHWKIAQGTLYNKPIRISFRDDVAQWKDSGEYPTCLQLAWHLDEVDEQGLPMPETQVQLDLFNDKLVAALEVDAVAHLVMVICNGGVNQWVFYTKDIDISSQALNTIPVEGGGYPIEVVADEDPDWSTFTEIYQAMQEES